MYDSARRAGGGKHAQGTIVFAPTDDRAGDLVLRLYQAAQDRSLLPSFMTELGRQFGSHVVGLRIHDPACDAFCSHYIESVGISVAEWRAFDRHTGDRNLWRTRGAVHLEAMGAGHDRMIMPRRELLRTSFYADLRTLDIEAGMGIRIWAGRSGQSAVLSLNRPCGSPAFGNEEMAFVQHLLPHFRNAYGIMRRLSWMDASSSSIACAMDRLRVGVLLLDADGIILYRNEAAGVALERRDALRSSGARRLCCADASAQRALVAAVRAAARGILDAPRRIANRDGTGGLRQVLVVAMVRGELMPWSGAEEPCAMVFVHKPTMALTDAEGVRLQELLHLTPAEVRLAMQLAAGNDPAACAALLGVSITTVRTQLRSLFQKTDTRRQPELIALLTFLLRLT